MASTKTQSTIWSSQTLTADAADTESAAQAINDGYGVALGVQLTNGGTAPTVAGQVQVQVRNTTSGFWANFGPALVAGLTNSGVYSWAVEISPAWKYFRLVGGSNTDEDVTADAEYSEISALS